MSKIFSNFEVVKLNISHPDIFYFMMFFLFFLLIIVTSKKIDGHKLLDVSHTTQLRGLAIFCIIFCHLWAHVSGSKPDFYIFTGYAVFMFLTLSGFGLAISSGDRKLDLKYFVSKRIYRVMMPYWIATIVILILDFIILDRLLPFNKIIMTLLGLNIHKELNHLDYVRWFVTFILFWYVIFFIGQNILKKSIIPSFYIFISLILLPLNYYIFHLGWIAFFAFPTGYFFARYYKNLLKVYNSKSNLFFWLSCVGFLYALIFNLILSNQSINSIIYDNIPNIALYYIKEFNNIILSICLIFISGRFVVKGFESKLLIYLGQYSYELMLLHGVFLIKYNPILRGSNDFYNYFGFILLVSMILGMSIILSKLSKLFYLKA
jgi:membrane-bound acyltransferase YfiQ involved in biofilm formation